MENKKLDALRLVLKEENVFGFVLPVNDEYMGEYIPEHAKRLTWLTGFTGSNGFVAVTQEDAAFFTDGRYILQAKEQVPIAHQYNTADESPSHWLSKRAKCQSIGFDPWLHTKEQVERYEAYGLHMVPLHSNPIDQLWKDRPLPPKSKAVLHPLEFAGESASSKLDRLNTWLKEEELDAIVITAPDSICWLLNIRGHDVPCTPFCLCFAIASANGKIDVFIDIDKVTEPLRTTLSPAVSFHGLENLDEHLATLKKQHIGLDTSLAPIWFYFTMQKHEITIQDQKDPCQAWKAVKNHVEIEGARHAHLRDAHAVIRALAWIETQLDHEEITELTIADRLKQYRSEEEHFQEESFATIAGVGEHGAIIHYHATPSSNSRLSKDQICLIDSGGQYLDGTTDITRTICVGMPTSEQKDKYTRVLKGHIALATQRFPKGTTGSQLDVLARQYLWNVGCDYDHGTGHGVGSYLSVHEGPQRISKLPSRVALDLGMIISNEPGYYVDHGYGIRIESLVLVVEGGFIGNRPAYQFETLTLVPMDPKLVSWDLLDSYEKLWLASYHQRIVQLVLPKLKGDEHQWLKTCCEVFIYHEM